MHLRSRVCCLLMGTCNAYQREAVLRSPLSCPSPSSDGNTLGVGLGCLGSGWGLDTDREEAGVAWSDTSGRGASSVSLTERPALWKGADLSPDTLLFAATQVVPCCLFYRPGKAYGGQK